MKKILSILVFFCLWLTGAAQTTVTVDKHIGIENGLSNNFIIDLTIDKRGHVWVATESGLNRVAGNIVTTFHRRDFSEKSYINAIGNGIRALYYDATTDKILIGMENGISIYDNKKASFRNISSDEGPFHSGINDIIHKGDGTVWLLAVNGSVWQMDCETLQMKELPIDVRRGIRCGYDDGNGRLFLGLTSEGLSVIDINSGKSKHYAHQEDMPNSLPGNNVRCIYQDDMKNIWVGTDHGVALFNPHKETFTKVTHTNAAIYDNVYSLKKFNDGLLWVASDMGGISFIDPDQAGEHEKNGTPITYHENKTLHLSSTNTRALDQDEFGNIWIGCHSTGLDFIAAQKPLFHTIPFYDNNNQQKRIYGLSADAQGNIWLGGEDEFSLCRDGRVINTWKITGGRRREHSFVMCLLADQQQNIWLGIEDDGVVKYDQNTRQFKRIEIGYAAPDIRSLAEDHDGRIWIGSEFGISSYKDGVVDREETLNKKIEHEHICSIMELNDGRILLATQAKGVFFVNPKTKEVLTISDKDGLPSYCVNGVCSDGRNGIWLGTYEGLAHIDDIRHPQQIETYDHRQGLKDNHIRALQCDRSGRVWLSTFTGISCFDPIKKRFYNYSHTDNLPSGSFISGSCATASDGTMFFASPNGVCFFNPQMLSHEQKVSEVQIVGLEAYNPAGEDTEIQHLVPNDKGYVYTTYKQNTLHITFGVKDFSQSGRVEYSYLMKGLNDEWYYIDNDDDVVFRGLRPGNYTFILRAKLKSQDWEDASTTEINIRIKPPFWRTWWAYLLYILVLGAIVWFLTDIYKRKLHLESSLELEKRDNMQKEELNEERLRFFTNITHELRTPLTLILGPLEDLINDRQLSDNYHKKLEVINKNAGRLRDLINQILEFRKTETQNRQLTVAKGDLGALVNEIGQFYKQLNRNPHVAVNIHVSDDVPPVYYDSEVIISIINNLMSNAVKYTEEGFINLSLTQDQQQQQTVITVEDSGYGIDPASLPYIFDRYYQVKGEHQASGTGIGLALVKSLADLHQGTLSVDSRLGEGAKFTFSILTENTYPNALHKEDPEEDDKQETDMLEVIETDADQRPVLLVVEDNSDIRQYIANSLGDDFQILQAADGTEGLDLAHINIPDIIVSDIMMPKMNGIELTRKLKDDINTSHIPIILLTAKDTVDDKLEGYESGADSYITKPFSSRLLLSRINNLLANRRRLSEIILNREPDTITSEPSQQYVADGEPHLSRLDRVFIEKMNRVIQEHIDTENLDMAFMTDKMAMSHSTFYRKVKALTGMTAKEYIRKIRLQRCAELLASGDYNVSEAASMIGFNDLGHFREVFKKEFGVAPSEYSKRNG